MSIFCIVFVKAIPGNPCSSQALHLLLCKMHADRNLDNKQALKFSREVLHIIKIVSPHALLFRIMYVICLYMDCIIEMERNRKYGSAYGGGINSPVF